MTFRPRYTYVALIITVSLCALVLIYRTAAGTYGIHGLVSCLRENGVDARVMNDPKGQMQGFGLGLSKSFSWMPEIMMLPTDFVSRVQFRGHSPVQRLDVAMCFRKYRLDLSRCI